ncbi:MAG: 3-hydroxyacyl-CoA dehydrogenase/enoyl-CoA hydratase/3-hydroxybutyryl-CoA epimerase [Oceanicoccus sp.]|jgi:3-hydroxyacyl-CoA dehydrogenase/enoyl-CoA hydratase/3-hydroxybutyryl-CoA epimerase
MSYFSSSKDADNIVTLIMDDTSRPVNVMNQDFIEQLEATVNQLAEEIDTVSGVILTSGKKTFFAGGDLDEILALEPHQAAEYGEKGLRIKASFRKLETLGKPVVAAINGAALGGGYEVCLATHYRVAIDQRGMVVGLPEVTLGLLPGAGGIVRLVRKVGLQAALPILSQGRNYPATAALANGMIDAIATDNDDMIAKARAWIKANPAASQPWDVKRFQFPGGNVDSREILSFIPIAGATLLNRRKGLYPAESAILNCAVESMRVDFDSASRIESRYLGSLSVTPEAKNMITYFFQMQKLQAGAARPEGFERSKINTLGILGAGMMGAGIAYCAAAAGINVVLKDVSAEQAEKGKAYSATVLDGLIKRGRASEQSKVEILARIKATADMADLSSCDLVVEAVFEKQALKATVTQQAEQHLPEHVVFASNTSTLPISSLATASRKPENFIGLHFFSPVDKMALVEIICGEQTSDETLARSYDFVKQIRKVPIVVNDSRCFYTSRVYEVYQDEAAWLLEDGVNPVLMENLAVQTGLPVGPLAANDEVAQRLIFDIKNSVRAGVEAEGGSYAVDAAPYQWMKKMVEELGRLGKASGAGYYDYPIGATKYIWPELRSLQSTQAKENATATISHQDIKDRLMFCQSVEAVRCLEENVLRSVEDCNIGSILGLGFPAYTGGQLQFINSYGVKAFAERAQQLADRFGARFQPPKLLIDKAATGEKF